MQLETPIRKELGCNVAGDSVCIAFHPGLSFQQSLISFTLFLLQMKPSLVKVDQEDHITPEASQLSMVLMKADFVDGGTGDLVGWRPPRAAVQWLHRAVHYQLGQHEKEAKGLNVINKAAGQPDYRLFTWHWGLIRGLSPHTEGIAGRTSTSGSVYHTPQTFSQTHCRN